MLKREGMVDYHAYVRINDIGVRLQRNALRCLIDLSNISAMPIRDVTISLSARDLEGRLLPVNGEKKHKLTLGGLSLEAAMRMVTEFNCEVKGIPCGIETEVEEVVFADGRVGEKRKPHKKIYFYKSFDETKQKEKEQMECLKKYSDHSICYAEKRNDGWLCTCGRLNRNRDDRCPECLSDRKLIFQKCTKEAILLELKREQKRRQSFSLKRFFRYGIIKKS